MEQQLNIFKKTLLFLQSFSKTRFGSGVIGFLIAASVSYGAYYFIWISFLEKELKIKTDRNIKLETDLQLCKDQKANIREIVRKEMKAEQREYLEFTYDYMQKVQDNISKTNIQKTKEIEELEQEIKKRKEVLK